MADQNKVLIRLVYGADHSLSKDSQEYELAEEIRRDEREECAYRAGIALLGADRGLANRVDKAIRARKTI